MRTPRLPNHLKAKIMDGLRKSVAKGDPNVVLVGPNAQRLLNKILESGNSANVSMARKAETGEDWFTLDEDLLDGPAILS